MRRRRRKGKDREKEQNELHLEQQDNCRFVCEQGVIGDTFHFRGNALSAASVDANNKMPVVAAYTDLVYPVFPDMAYEVPTLFAAPKMTFTAEFVHEVIIMRKAAAAKLSPVSSVA
jgi:hypothetical protein